MKIPVAIRKTIDKFSLLIKDGFGYIFIAYIAIISIYLYFFILRKAETYDFFDSHFEKGFGSSFASSFLEDLFMFTFLGLVVTIVSTVMSYKNPVDYDYRTRLSALLNSEVAYRNQKLHDYVHQQFRSILGFNTHVRAFISVHQFIADEAAFKIYAELEHTIAAAVKDLGYIPNSSANKVKVYSDAQVEGVWGIIKQLKVCDSTGKVIKNYVEGPVIRLEGPIYEQDVDFEVLLNNQLVWSLHHEVWHKIFDDGQASWYGISVSRYTQILELIIENDKKFDRILTYDVNLYRDADKTYSVLHEGLLLEKGQKRSHTIDMELFPKDRIHVNIHQPDNKTAMMKHGGGGSE